MQFYQFSNGPFQAKERFLSIFYLMALTLVLLASGLVIGGGLILLLPFGRCRRLDYANWSMAIFAGLCLRVCGHRWRFVGAGLPQRQAIFVANHSSTVDTFLMPSLFPPRTSVIAKKEIIWFPVIGQLAWLGSFLLIDRDNPDRSAASLKSLSKRIHEDRINLWLMPEGTRSRDGQLARFKTGFVHLAVATGLPVIPIVLHDTYRLWPAGTLRCRPGEVLVEVLDPIDTSAWRAADAREIAATVREQIRKRLVAGPADGPR
ncbi:MAG: hypothetical protein CMH55_03900 [Myxococcales bacterium]|nr:hypothetical protein [Myxococcales bacterium]